MRNNHYQAVMLMGLIGCLGKTTINRLEFTKLKDSIFKPINSERMNNSTRQRTKGKVTGTKVLED